MGEAGSASRVTKAGLTFLASWRTLQTPAMSADCRTIGVAASVILGAAAP
jgi:hypothetical protein